MGTGPLARAAGRQPTHPHRSLQAADRGPGRRPSYRPGGGVATRQLLPDRGTDSHGQAALARRLQPGVASSEQRPIGGASARVRYRAGNHLARGWTGGSRGPDGFRGGLPDCDRPQAGRIVGHSHHVAPGSHREPAARGCAGRRCADRARSSRRLGRADGRGSQEGSEEPNSGDRGHGASQPTHGQFVRR